MLLEMPPLFQILELFAPIHTQEHVSAQCGLHTELCEISPVLLCPLSTTFLLILACTARVSLLSAAMTPLPVMV